MTHRAYRWNSRKINRTPSRAWEWGRRLRLSFKINDHPRREILLLRHRRYRDRTQIDDDPVRGITTTYQAYRSQNDLWPLDECDRIERGPGLSATVRSAVHLSATEAKISKLSQRLSAHALPPLRPGVCTRRDDQTWDVVSSSNPYDHPRPNPRNSPYALYPSFDFPCSRRLAVTPCALSDPPRLVCDSLSFMKSTEMRLFVISF